MSNLAQLVDIPPRSELNPGLSRLRPSTALQLLGSPGTPGAGGRCGTVSPRLASMMATRRVANLQLRMRLLEPLLESLETIFEEVRQADAELFEKARTNGSTCVRRIGGSTSFSLHSFGLAVDLGFGRPQGNFIEADPRGDGMTEVGLLKLAPFFNRHGWFWGGAFSGSGEDAMHFEASEQLLRRVLAGGGPPPGGGGTFNPPTPQLNNPRFVADPTLVEVAAGRRILQRSGVRSESVGIVQDALNSLRKKDFRIPFGRSQERRGFFDPNTETAVINFQNSENLDDDGIVGKNTLRALDRRSVEAEGADGDLEHPILSGSSSLQAVAAGHLILERSGGRQDGVGELQDALNALAQAKPRYAVNTGEGQRFRGLFGPNTERAVKNFQSDHDIEADGRVGAGTIKTIDKALDQMGGTPLPEDVRRNILAGPGGYMPPESARAALGTIPIGDGVELEPRDFGITESDIDVLIKMSNGALFYEGGMQTDADGSPRAEQIDRFGQLQTAFNFPGQTGQRKFVNAEEVNYIVLPGNNPQRSNRFFNKMGFRLGDVAAVIHDGIVEFAMFADVGPINKLGEGSVHLVQALGTDPFINGMIRRGIPDEVVYLVFPDSRPPNLTPGNANTKIAAAGKRLFEQMGGIVP